MIMFAYNRRARFSLAVVLCFIASTALAELVVITHKATVVTSLTAAEVKSLYLKKTTTFPHTGTTVDVADQGEASSQRQVFTSKVLKKSTKQLTRYWSKKVFSGKGTPPTVVGDGVAMKTWVEKTVNSLGYVDATLADGNVKILLKIP